MTKLNWPVYLVLFQWGKKQVGHIAHDYVLLVKPRLLNMRSPLGGQFHVLGKLRQVTRPVFVLWIIYTETSDAC